MAGVASLVLANLGHRVLASFLQALASKRCSATGSAGPLPADEQHQEGLYKAARVAVVRQPNAACHGPEPWEVSWFTAMFMHGSWDHILGNMLFLAIFGKNVEDAFGHLRYLAFYIAGGFVAFMTQTAMTLLFFSAAAGVPNLGASGAIAAVLGAYFVLYPNSRVLTLVLVFPIRIPAWIFLGVWFLYQFIEGNFGLFSAHANGGGVAFSAHVGGFMLGVIVGRAYTRARKRTFARSRPGRLAFLKAGPDAGALIPRLRSRPRVACRVCRTWR